MLEMLETELELFNGEPVILVRPSFGTQSDSWCGDLLPYDTTTSPMKFQVVSDTTGLATIFTTEDIQSTQSVKKTPVSKPHPRLIINLKGPKDYVKSPAIDTYKTEAGVIHTKLREPQQD